MLTQDWEHVYPQQEFQIKCKNQIQLKKGFVKDYSKTQSNIFKKIYFKAIFVT